MSLSWPKRPGGKNRPGLAASPGSRRKKTWRHRRQTMQLGQKRDAAGSHIAYSADLKQYLTFTLGREEYGIEILKVQEIKGYSAITPIPNTPAHVKGVMNLRGTVIPVVDLRSKFAMEAVEYTKFTVIIVASVGEKIVGIVVDAVSDVLTVSRGNIRPA